MSTTKTEVKIKAEPRDDLEHLDLCKYCSDICEPYERPGIRCHGICGRKIHVTCLKRGGVPSPLAGDVFYHFTCEECSTTGEVLTRDKLAWFGILALTLYNLREKSSGISKRGYFHWKSDISTFVDRNWDHLFQRGVKRKKNWIGTISGTLSHFSGTFFKSGTAELGESGWWRLVDNHPPEILIEKNTKMLSERRRQAVNQPKFCVKQYNSPTPSESSTSVGEDSNCAIDTAKTPALSMYSRAYVQPTEMLSDFLMADDDMQVELDMLDIDDKSGLNDRHDSPSIVDMIKDVNDQMNQPNNNVAFSHILNNLVPEWMNDMYDPAANFIDDKADEVLERDDEEQQNSEDEQNSDSSESVKETPTSLFTIKTRRDWPWKKKPSTADKKPQMSYNEEAYLLQSVNKSDLKSLTPSVRRLYRKLAVRKLKREYSLPLFDIDRFTTNPEANRKLQKQNNRILDRFYRQNLSGFFEQRLQGYHEPASIHSPYTNRLLKPFIRRDTSCRPLWLRVMDELCAKVNKNNPTWKPDEPGSIDYCYVRPHHIPAINSLARQFFWPGIDLSECLQYPDFSCVVLYKKLLVGFAILVPDVGCNEAYISFFLTRPEWRKSGIGTFMLYHLIQTCMGKDLTLHVSATNPALILYQKFGFKIEEFIQDFYDKYMPPGPRNCRHALFLRLNR